MSRIRRYLAWLIGCMLVLSLSACKMDLFTKQTEGDANDMVSGLREQGIAAEKDTPDGGKTWTVRVEEDDIVRATNILHTLGLPVERHDNLGQIFKKEGLISTPTEERVRFIHGVSQELSETLTQIDGVVVARVQIVLPQNDPLAPVSKPSSASVFVKHRPEANVRTLIPSIKNLVSRSVEGLPYDNVSVTMVSGAILPAPAPLPRSTAAWWWSSAGIAVLTLLGIGGWLVWRRPDLLPQAMSSRLPRLVSAAPPTAPHREAAHGDESATTTT